MPINSKITTVLFDLDQTLLDEKAATETAVLRFHSLVAAEFEIDLATFTAAWLAAIPVHYKRFEANEISFQEQRRERVRDSLAVPRLSAEEADKLFENYLQCYRDSWHLFPGVVELLSSLQDYKLGIVTNGASQQQRYKLSKLGLSNHFSSVIVSEEVGYAKPDERIFEAALQDCQSKAGETVYVGDKLESDALAAASVGMWGVWVRHGQERPTAAEGSKLSADISVISEIRELSDLF